MCVRLNATDLLANILSSDALREGTIIERSKFLLFQNRLDDLIPGHIFYETDDEDISAAVKAFQGCCMMDYQGNIHVLDMYSRPRRDDINEGLPAMVSFVLPDLADSFAEKEFV